MYISGIQMDREGAMTEWRAKAGIGVTEYLPGDSSETILHRADQAMCVTKMIGRDRIVLV